MPRFRLLAPALFVLSAACGPAEEAPPSFATDQPRFFQGLNLLSDDTRTAFPDFERRWDRIAQDTIARLEAGEIVEEKEQKSAAQALLYAAFALVAGQHALEDGYLRPAELVRPPRYSKGDDVDEQRARMQRAREWLKHAADLDPSDDRIATVIRSCTFNLQTSCSTSTRWRVRAGLAPSPPSCWCAIPAFIPATRHTSSSCLASPAVRRASTARGEDRRPSLRPVSAG